MRARFEKLLVDLRKPSLAWGYIAIALIGAASTLGIWFYKNQFSLTKGGDPSYPFVTFSIALFFLICIARPLWLVIRLHPEPLKQIRQDIIDNRWWLVTSALMAVSIPQALQFSGTMKKAIPLVVPFYADNAIIEIEVAVLGRDAWEITHAILGATSTRIIDTLYGLWHLVNISMLCWMVLTRDKTFQVRLVLAYQLCWILLGGVMATALSSVGPCFLDIFTGDPRYLPLMERLREIGGSDGLHSLTAMGYLLANEGKDAFGSGISAMPSLHVAIAYLTVLVAFDRTKSWPVRLVAIGYLLAIVVGSVHLGWHYLADGIVVIPFTHTIWWMSGHVVRRLTS